MGHYHVNIYSYSWWLQKCCITIDMSQIHKQLSSASCPFDETAVFRRVAYWCWPMIHPISLLCHESSSVGIYCHMTKSNKLVQLNSCLCSFLIRVPTNRQADLQHVSSNSNDGYDVFSCETYVWLNTIAIDCQLES